MSATEMKMTGTKMAATKEARATGAGTIAKSETARQKSGPLLIDNVRLTATAVDRLLATLAEFRSGRRAGRRIVLSNCDLAGLPLAGKDFSEGEFLRCSFAGADLAGARFSRSRLIGSNFAGSNLARADFSHADLRSAGFDGSNLSEVILSGADLRQIEMLDAEGAPLSGVQVTSFRDADLTNAEMSWSKAKDVDFSGARMEGAELRNADLRGSVFRGAALTGTSIAGARIEEADFTDSEMAAEMRDLLDQSLAIVNSRRRLGPARLAEILGAHVVWVQSNAAKGARAILDGLDLSGRNLAGSNLIAASLVGADLSRADLSRARLLGADLTAARIEGASLAGADLRGAALDQATMELAGKLGARIGALALTRTSGSSPRAA